MKKFAAIGHWKGTKNITCIVGDARTQNDFYGDCKGNGFVAYAILSEKKLEAYKAADFLDRHETLNNCWHVLDVEEYLDQCMDIIESKLAAI